MTKKTKIIKITKSKLLYIKILGVLLILPILLSVFFILFNGRIMPGVKINNIPVGGMIRARAVEHMRNTVTVPQEIVVRVIGAEENYEDFVIPIEKIDLQYDFEESVNNAYQLGRSGQIFSDVYLIVSSVLGKVNFDLVHTFDSESLTDSTQLIAGIAPNKPTYPSISIDNGIIVLNNGTSGQELDPQELDFLLVERISHAKISGRININAKLVDASLSLQESATAIARAEKLLSKYILLTHESGELKVDNLQMLSLINPAGGYDDIELNLLVIQASKQFDRLPENPVFVQQGTKVVEFEPGQTGLEINKNMLIEQMYKQLLVLENTDAESASIDIPMAVTPPELQIADINNLGIVELIGRGKSEYKGSISSRIHNISIATKKLNGVLMKPGETFSFNGALGDISVYTGYKQSYIISGGSTILGDGGGVCQVSTTFFRAALNSGLEIVNRRAHSYRVGYYEQDQPPGLDATIYSPTVDLKVKNDTPGYILIQAKADTGNRNLIIEFYGTSDGREVTLSEPVVTGVTPPPEDLYIDDPTKPIGTIEQIDWKAWGAKSSFAYTVVRDGEVLQDRTFYSNYKPWQAKFLRGTGPAI